MTLHLNQVHCGDARDMLLHIDPESIALSFWSPPYHVGKEYEKGHSFEDWQNLLRVVIKNHFPALRPGGFLVINIGDILVFTDEDMPRIQASNPALRKHAITTEDVLAVLKEHPHWNRYQVAKLLGCSEQTIDRRLHGNNIRGGKHGSQTRVKLVGGLIEQFALLAGLYLYDRRIWAKDPAWVNSQWHNSSYRSVDESEYLYVFWKPGITHIDRGKLTPKEWTTWGSRGVWHIPSVRANDNHEAKFPLELARRVIRLYSQPGDTVLDCFVGSGTTAIAALKEGRDYLGIELLEKYVRLARKLIDAELETLDRGQHASDNDKTKRQRQSRLF